jgi:hypothetical protein
MVSILFKYIYKVCLPIMNEEKFSLRFVLLFVSIIVIFLFIFIIIAGLLVPIYADEVSTKITQATIFDEEWRLRTLIPQCLPDLTIEPPITWVPAAVFYNIAYFWLSPLGIRVASVLTALTWVAMFAKAVCIFVEDKFARFYIGAILAAIAGLGVLPLTFVLARSEQWLLLLLMFFVLFPFWISRSGYSSPLSRKMIFLGLFCITTSLIYYAHVKAVFFFPVLLVSAWFGLRRLGIVPFVIGVSYVVFCTFQTIEFAKYLFHCESAPILAGYFASQTTKLNLFFSSPILVISELFSNIVNAPLAIGEHLIFSTIYQSSWLPSSPLAQLTSWTRGLNNLIISIFLGVYFLAVFLPPWIVFLAFGKNLTIQVSLLGSLWVGFIAHLALYKVWNFYSGALIVGLELLILLLFFTLPQISYRDKKLISVWLYFPVILIFLASSFFLMGSVGVRLISLVGDAEVGIPDQPLSVPVFGFSSKREKIRNFAQSCGISGDGVRRLVIDDLTYFAFDNLKEPIHLVYLFEGGFGVDIKGELTRKLLVDLNAYGIIAQCTFMPSIFKEEVRSDGSLCCLKFPF